MANNARRSGSPDVINVYFSKCITVLFSALLYKHYRYPIGQAVWQITIECWLRQRHIQYMLYMLCETSVIFFNSDNYLRLRCTYQSPYKSLITGMDDKLVWSQISKNGWQRLTFPTHISKFLYLLSYQPIILISKNYNT